MASVTWSPRDSSFISHFPFNATSKQANKNDAKGSLYAIQSNLHHYKTDTLKIFFHCACNRTALQEPNLPTRESIDVKIPFLGVRHLHINTFSAHSAVTNLHL